LLSDSEQRRLNTNKPRLFAFAAPGEAASNGLVRKNALANFDRSGRFRRRAGLRDAMCDWLQIENT